MDVAVNGAGAVFSGALVVRRAGFELGRTFSPAWPCRWSSARRRSDSASAIPVATRRLGASAAATVRDPRCAMALRPDDFRFLRAFVRDAAAIVLDPLAPHVVEARLSSLAAPLEPDGLAKLVDELRRQRRGSLAQRVLDQLTTNETSFYRDVAPFQHLRRHVLPALIDARRERRELAIWCAAASSGQEALSLQLLLCEEFPELANWSVRLLASDVSRTMVARCREGLYTQLEVERGLSPSLLAKYFERCGGDWRVSERVRGAIEWREFNLAGREWSSLPSFDLVLLRNVMIYFDEPTQRGVLANVRRVLRPGGFVMLGTAETLVHLDEAFRSEPALSSCYRLAAA